MDFGKYTNFLVWMGVYATVGVVTDLIKSIGKKKE